MLPIQRIPYHVICFGLQWLCIMLFRTRIIGMRNVPKRRGVLLVCNHQSFMDPVLAGMALGIYREGNYMARDSLFHPKWFGKLISYLNTFPVKRGTADLTAIKEAMRRLKQGRVVLVFPEGTRSPDGRITPMLAGLATFAKKCEVPVVPVLVDGMAQAWPRHQLLPRRGDVIVQYDKAIWPAEYASMSAEELTQTIRQRIVRMQTELHRRVPWRRLEWYGQPDGCQAEKEAEC